MAGRKKIVNHSALRVNAKYDAAGTGRRTRGWTPPPTGPNKAMDGLQRIRDRARDVVRNDWSGESSTQKWATNLVGIGIRARITRLVDKARKQAINDAWDDWTQRADADGVLTFYGLQTLATRTWLDSGEVFVRLRSRRGSFGLDVPMQVQLIEPDFVPMFDATAWPGMPTGNRIRSGIELDNRGQRVAYWMHREHPGDAQASVDAGQLLRIPASEVLHVFEPKRAGQLRGVSALASVLTRLRGINDYDDAVLERQKLANLFVLFVTRQLAGTDPLTGLPDDGDTSPLAALEPGLMQELAPGEDVKFSNPPEAGTTYSDYMRTQHMGTAAAAGLPYEIFAGDIQNVSDRTLRVLVNEFRRFAEQRQWQILIPMFCQPIRAWWVQAAVLSGVVRVREADAVRRVEWATHGWAHIHPVQDPQGKKLEVDAGFRSRSSVVGERGDDPEAVDAERAQDKIREDNLGLSLLPVQAPSAPAPPAPSSAPAPAAQQPTDNGAAKSLAHLVDEIGYLKNAFDLSVRAQAVATAAHATPPTVHLSAPITLQVPEQAAQPAPVINFTAPDVQVDVHVPEQAAPVVNLAAQPAPTVIVQAFPKQAVQTVETDADGNVTKTVTTYEQGDAAP